MRQPIIAALAVFNLAMLPALAAPAADEAGITGQVNIRPVRPHATLGTPNLAPYQTKLQVSDASGHVVASTETDANGQFRIPLPPGTYIIKPLSPGPYPRASEQTVVVSPRKFSPVTVTYDSGIR